MNARQSETVRRFRSIVDFLSEAPFTSAAGDIGAALTSAAGDIGAALGGLRETIEEIVAHAGACEAAHRLEKESGLRVRTLAAVLRLQHMRPISCMARFALPGAHGQLPAFASSGNSAVPDVIAAAQRMTEAAAPHVATFTRGGLTADFIERLRGAARELAEAAVKRSATRARGVAATRSLAAAIGRGHAIVRFLDAIATPALANEPTRLAGWRAVCRARSLNCRQPVAGLGTTEAPRAAACVTPYAKEAASTRTAAWRT